MADISAACCRRALSASLASSGVGSSIWRPRAAERRLMTIASPSASDVDSLWFRRYAATCPGGSPSRAAVVRRDCAAQVGGQLVNPARTAWAWAKTSRPANAVSGVASSCPDDDHRVGASLCRPRAASSSSSGRPRPNIVRRRAGAWAMGTPCRSTVRPRHRNPEQHATCRKPGIAPLRYPSNPPLASVWRHCARAHRLGSRRSRRTVTSWSMRCCAGIARETTACATSLRRSL